MSATPRQAATRVKRAYTRAQRAEDAMKAATAELRGAAADAYEAGVTDAQIAELLGVSRARAYQLRMGRNR